MEAEYGIHGALLCPHHSARTLTSMELHRLDRDLGLAGRIIVSDKQGNFASKLVKIDRPIIRIPTLAIHRKYSDFPIPSMYAEFL